ncbi:SGNH/GDSL hydrolase family protein [Mycolicibacterium fluoranthenivorans]|uniref:Lysophospholipase L1 n=1 Tax=Mycolicibacterium fluoranthenivorans TaxID=258505 RepID=A0A1G4WQP2_9MYCO|nr:MULTISPECIES: SGNH/GDSL hydrolase family protein [Mycobacteriaceae]MCV7250973.1 SGNH/GDSL hydrolase family protein [Mycobacterium hackensackense]QNJ90838.1 SGNH/GDSL hydrolase family protein [Mycolicibacterium fluoranthenivorans]SCX27602.1 Lysophospholipase L1 [Mycolicibacterium fluoranthenivorans]
MVDVHYSRYVALGDSQTEGLWDTDDTGALIGFADRLAWLLDGYSPGIEYANLAVRGKRIRDVLEVQLPEAVAMRPDLITMCVGMNDVTRPGRKFDQALVDLDILHDRLALTGATVVTTTFPNLARVLPAGRILVARVLRINDVIRAAADRHGFRLIDLYHADSMTDPENWSTDRVHGSTKGHQLFTAAAAEALGLPGSSHDWAYAAAADTEQSLRSRLYSQAMWTQNMLMPWIWRHLRGRSASIGGGPRHPQLSPVVARSDAR